jgi:hypothetical protein
MALYFAIGIVMGLGLYFATYIPRKIGEVAGNVVGKGIQAGSAALLVPVEII